ncbi:hypothetical protein [Metabacillus fastidiosus]|uniref:hypothetical protein n=1 Tax=Metabacillus fastidiosus TaxID=1458 RepID=UPI002E221D6A|nr:hypothetical protein [Metabacillus fastidiosus]
MKKSQSRLRKMMLPILAFVLVLYTVLPYIGVFAAGEEIKVDLETRVTKADNSVSKIITEEKIRVTSDTIELILTLGNNEWAKDINTSLKKQLLIKNMTADVYQAEFEKLLDESLIVYDPNVPNKLIIKLKNDNSYKISQNQIITINISSALIENWEGQVAPISFKIYEQPRIFVDGSILNAAVDDIKNGGKEIRLNLINAYWNKEKVTKLTELNKILDRFVYSNNTPWEVVEVLKLKDPNTYVSLEDNDRTLKLRLPAISKIINPGTVEFKSFVSTDLQRDNLYTIDKVDGIEIESDLIESTDENYSQKFTIKSAVNLTNTPENLTESNIKNNSSAKIDLKLTGVQWKIDTPEKENVLIDALIAKNEVEQWEKVKSKLKATPGSITVLGDTLTINIPKIDNYYLTADQKISLQVPYQLLEDKFTLQEQEFIIKATPKALISGTVTPTVSQADIVKGGKTIVVTLVNTKWKDNIATNTVMREDLLNRFNWPITFANNNLDQADLMKIIKAKAHVERTNDQAVTITLPPIDGLKVPNKQNIKVSFTPKESWTTAQLSTFDISTIDAFTVNPLAEEATAKISGTILPSTNEFDIVKGGKTITITLKSDIWVKDVEKQLNTGIFSVKDGNIVKSLDIEQIKRDSDAAVTITLKESPNFYLTNDATVDLKIPANLLSVSTKDIEMDSAFKINAVKAELSGTGISLDEADIQKGGKTIIVTLQNATFKSDLDSKQLISAFKNKSNLQWDLVNYINDAIEKDPKNIKITNNSVTIKLPAVPNYKSTGSDEITLTIPSNLINDANLSKKEIKGDKSIVIGANATAVLTGGPFTNAQIKAGNNNITITLGNGAKWDENIVTNKSKRSALLKGFSTKDQTKEWSLISTEIQSNGNFKLSDDNNKLTITIPSVSDYSIIRNQEIDIIVPKSVLVNYKYDIKLLSKLVITIPSIAVDKTLGELLKEDLAAYINAANGAENIRVTVPKKKVETISVNTVEFTGSGNTKENITTIEVTAASDVRKVQLTVKGQNSSVTRDVEGNGKFTAVFQNVEKNSELTVSVFSSGSSDPLQKPIYKKISGGSKTYNEQPKKDLTGSYTLYSLLTNKTLLKDILKYYSLDELKVGK